jgi:hypothetical protein
MKEPIIDQWELVQKTVCSHMKPFVQAVMEDNEFTRRKVSENTEILNRVANRHMWVRDVAIVILFFGMIILFSQ